MHGFVNWTTIRVILTDMGLASYSWCLQHFITTCPNLPSPSPSPWRTLVDNEPIVIRNDWILAWCFSDGLVIVHSTYSHTIDWPHLFNISSWASLASMCCSVNTKAFGFLFKTWRSYRKMSSLSIHMLSYFTEPPTVAAVPSLLWQLEGLCHYYVGLICCSLRIWHIFTLHFNNFILINITYNCF